MHCNIAKVLPIMIIVSSCALATTRNHGLPIPDLRDTDSLAAVIRFGYHSLSLLVEPSGTELKFDLSDFQTIYREDFDKLLYKDVMTLEGGDSIRMTRVFSSHDTEHVYYQPHWQHIPYLVEGLNDDKRELYETIVYDEYFRLSRGVQELEHVAALTTYQVVARIHDRMRRYKASFIWIHGRKGASPNFQVLDDITVGIEDAMVEEKNPGRPRPTPWIEPNGLSNFVEKSATCKFEMWKANIPSDTITSGQNHSDGGHMLTVDSSEMTCRCAVDCSLEADMKEVPSVNPFEFGTLKTEGRCHKLGIPNADQSCSRAPEGHTQPSGSIGCKVGFRGLWKECSSVLGCSCSVLSASLGVSGYGISAVFTIQGDRQGALDWGDDTWGSCRACNLLSSGGSPDEPSNDEECGAEGDQVIEGCGASPLIFDLDRGGFELTGLEDPVVFDINGDGVADEVAWTASWSEDGFLALDIDRNGLIDDGKELFGNYTVDQAGSGVPNGYRALAVYDVPWIGGNGDGRISREDDVFSSLLIWIDRSHDGISQPSELVSLEDVGIESIELDYRETRRRDRWGNWYRFASYATLNGRGNRRVRTVDVYFRTRWGIE